MRAKRNPRSTAERIVQTLKDAGHTALLAGGCVRDLLLGQSPKDYDVATSATPPQIVKLFRRTDLVGAKFGVVLVHLDGFQIEVATFRTDGTYADGRHPDSVTFGSEQEDARRRDFTINGMFYDITADRLIDHVGGQEDLKGRIVRAIGDPERRFAEDHLRMLRAVRFAARLGFEIEPVTRAAIAREAHLLAGISAERVREELKLMLTGAAPARAWEMLASTGLSQHVISGMRWDPGQAADVERRLAVAGGGGDFIVALAVLLVHRAADEAARACRRLRSPNAETKGVAWLLTHLPRVRRQEELDLADLKLLAADARFELLTTLLHVELTAAGSPMTAHADLLQRVGTIPAEQLAPPAIVTGEDLLALGIAPGPIFSRVLATLYRAQLNLEFNSKEEALGRLGVLLANAKSESETRPGGA